MGIMKRGLLTWHAKFSEYSFLGHPITAEKYHRFKALFDDAQLPIDVLPISPMEMSYLEKALTPNHFAGLVKMSASGEGWLDPATPAFRGMLNVVQYMCQATYTCLKAVLSESHSFGINIAGGLHHATPNASMGGCVVNDVGIAIRRIRSEGITKRIAILDFDYHPHNGTVTYFGGDENVLLS